jgi:hypothetical protein
MFDQLLTGPFVPFTLALALLFGLMLLELVFALLGGTLLGAGGEMDGPDIDGPDIDMPDVADMDLDIDFDAVDIDPGDLEMPGFDDLDVDAPDGVGAPGGLAAWLGFGKMPALIWLASLLMSFGISGLVVQSVVNSVLGFVLPAALAAIPALVAGVWFTRSFGTLFARLLPKTETEALSERHLGRRTGVVTQGTAARGRPAEVKVTDRFGNSHYLRAEPLNDAAQIPQGSEVLVLRHRLEGGYLLVPLTP